MKKIENNILDKVELYLEQYKDDNSIYYQELKKSYNEYKHIDLKDKVTNDLYIKHLNELCDFIKSKKHANRIIFMLIVSSIFIIILSCFTTLKYYELSRNLESNVLLRNGSTNLNINYGNMEKFNVNSLSDEYNFMNLEPLTITILPYNKTNKQQPFHYDVYLVEENNDIENDNFLSKDAFLYNISTSNKESGIKYLKNAKKRKKRLLIFSGETLTNQEEEIELRMWIDSNTNLDYINKKYKFKIYIEGYIQ